MPYTLDAFGSYGSQALHPISDFFSGMASSIGEGLNRVASDILPNWVAGQANLQLYDQLRDITYNQAYAPATLNPAIQGSTTQTPSALQTWFDKYFTEGKSVQVSGSLLLIVLAGGAALYLLLFKK